MHRYADGSAVLNPDEAKAVARVLDLGRQVCEQLEADKQHAASDTVEYNLLITLDLLEDLGVSSAELTKGLDHIGRSG